MLYDSVREIISHPEKIRYLVSRDTEDLSPSDIRKAAIETYAENLSDGVIAPLLYLVLFGLPGAFVYKAINTLDSMVGYRNERYEKFGKFAARLDDAANYIPARITAAVIIVLMSRPAFSILHSPFSTVLLRQAKAHPSPNAGYPIAAMACALGIRLGGPTRYFGELKPKAWLGQGRSELEDGDIERALKLQGRLDILVIVILALGAWSA
jgi:adenosylcobinamide-phosphate synthase